MGAAVASSRIHSPGLPQRPALPLCSYNLWTRREEGAVQVLLWHAGRRVWRRRHILRVLPMNQNKYRNRITRRRGGRGVSKRKPQQEEIRRALLTVQMTGGVLCTVSVTTANAHTHTRSYRIGSRGFVPQCAERIKVGPARRSCIQGSFDVMETSYGRNYLGNDNCKQ